jgi:hypothetical protein
MRLLVCGGAGFIGSTSCACACSTDRDNAWWWEPIRSGGYRDYYQRQYSGPGLRGGS